MDRLQILLTENGYQKLDTQLHQVTYFCKMIDTQIICLCLVTQISGDEVTKEEISRCHERLKKGFRDRGILACRILNCIITASPERERDKVSYLSPCWLIDASTGQLMIYEDQPADFFEVKELIEHALSEEDGTGSILLQREFIPWVTVLLVAMNTILFVVCAMTGQVLYNIGDFSALHLLDVSQYYRLISSMFLHINTTHLAGNMILLLALGRMIEKFYGHGKFLIMYLFSGLCGSFLSAAYDFAVRDFTHSIGASGAIMGLVGAMVALLIWYKGHYYEITMPKILFVLAYILFEGFRGDNVNNMAHIGGVIGGFAFTMLYLVLSHRPHIQGGMKHED